MIFDSKYNIYYWIALDIIIVFILIIEAVLFVLAIYTTNKKPLYINLEDAGYETPIVSISEIDVNGKCGGETFPLVFGTWPGTVEGCYCDKLNNIVRGECTHKMIEDGCDEIKMQMPKDILIWKGKRFCISTYELNPVYDTYLHNLLDGDVLECKQDFKKCGLLDTLQQIMCVPEHLACPLNDLYVSRDPTYISEKGIIYSTIQLNDGYYMHHTNEDIDNYIITSLELSEGQICLSKNEFNTKYSPYILDTNYSQSIEGCKTVYENQRFDPSYIYVDKMKKETLYKDNDLLRTKTQVFNEQSLNANIRLYRKSFYGIKLMCRNYQDEFFNKIILYDILFDQGIIYRDVFLFAIISIIMMALLYQLLMIIYKCFVYYYIPKWLNWVEFGIMLFHIGIGICSAISYNIYGKLHNRYINCGDEYIQLIMKNSKNNLDILQRYLLIISVFAFISVILYPSDILLNIFVSGKFDQLIQPRADINKLANNDDASSKKEEVNKQGNKQEDNKSNKNNISNSNEIKPEPKKEINEDNSYFKHKNVNTEKLPINQIQNDQKNKSIAQYGKFKNQMTKLPDCNDNEDIHNHNQSYKNFDTEIADTPQ